MGRVAWPQLLMGGRLFQKMLVGKGVGLGRVLSENPAHVRTNIKHQINFANDRYVCMFHYPRT